MPTGSKVLRRKRRLGYSFEDLTIYRCQDYEDAVNRQSLAKPGDVVVLSPAGTSYDRFRHFEERGNLFKDLVNRLSPEDESDSEQANERQI